MITIKVSFTINFDDCQENDKTNLLELIKGSILDWEPPDNNNCCWISMDNIDASIVEPASTDNVG